MSDVVVEEVKVKIKHRLELASTEIIKKKKEINQITYNEQPYFDLPDPSYELHFYDLFISEMVRDKTIQLINTPPDILPIIQHRAIHRLKPFDRNNLELKDAIIWYSYKAFSEEKGLSECYLLTENTTDFSIGKLVKDRRKLIPVHPELLDKSDNFVGIYTNVFSFIEGTEITPVPPKTTNLELTSAWKNKADKLGDILLEKYSQEILMEVSTYANEYKRDIFRHHRKIHLVYASSIKLNKFVVKDIVGVTEGIAVSAQLTIDSEVDGFKYSPPQQALHYYTGEQYLEPGETNHVESSSITRTLFCSFMINTGENSIANFEIDLLVPF